MKTFFKRFIVLFVLLVMVVNQVGPASALGNTTQPAAAASSEQDHLPISQREQAKKADAPKVHHQPKAPEPAKVVIGLSASPKFVTESGQEVTIRWQISGDLPAGSTPTLKISFPEGYSPTGAAGYDAASRTLSIPVSAASGQFSLAVQNPLDEAVFPATLLDATQTVIAAGSLSLPKHEKFNAKKNGASLSAEKGRVKVAFGKKSLPEDAIINIGAPAGDDAPKYSLSGHPFEIQAQGVQSGQDISQFAEDVSIDVDYRDFDLQGKNENDLHLYYYDPASDEWYPLPTIVDAETKTLHATTSHFTVFDTGLHEWEASRLPTVDGFQVSGFTGAATYSMPIEVPAGPGGMQPSLSLSYNSQVIDQSTSQTQASWVGMGWSLDMNSIELNDHGTNESNTEMNWTSDDTWFINVNGISSLIVRDGDAYRAADENFMKFVFDSENDIWKVLDKQGNTYYFEKSVQMVDSSLMHCGPAYQTYRWMLTRISNIFEQELTYTYATTTTTVKVKDWNSTLDKCQLTRSVEGVVDSIYPETITYPGGRYRIRFELEDRLDVGLPSDGAYRRFDYKRLHAIHMEQSETGNGLFNKLIRKYEFEYASNDPAAWIDAAGNYTESAPIWPGLIWLWGGRTTTLLRVHQFGKDGTKELPTATFYYGDHMHLTRVDNGYGGGVSFEYELWYYADNARPSMTYEQGFGYGGGCGDGGFAPYPEGAGVVECEEFGNGARALRVRGQVINTSMLGTSTRRNKSLRPGGIYKFTFWRAQYFGDNTTMKFGFRINEDPDKFLYTNDPSGIIKLPTDAAKVDVMLNVEHTVGESEYVHFRELKIELLSAVYRVTTRTITDGEGHANTYSYDYAGAAVNDSAHSAHACSDDALEATPPTCQQYSEKYSEFRGHSQVTETTPDGRVTITTYHQDDVLKGRPITVTVQNASGKKFSQQIIDYWVSPMGVNTLFANSLQYNDVLHNWIITKQEENRLYAENGTYEATQVRYGFEPVYGNLLTTTELFRSGTSWIPRRVTTLEYSPNIDGGTYLTGLPSRQYVTDAAGNFLAQTLNIYDTNTNWNMPPVVGKLKKVRSWAGNDNYNQVYYSYDGWGNRITTTLYNSYASSGADPSAGSGLVQRTVFDPTYHTYPVEQRTPAMPGFPDGFVTKFDYDYTLGLPISQTDPNGVLTRVRYDEFGRLTKLIKPGDGDASPALEITYYDNSLPFRIMLRQKVDSTRSYFIRHTYNGIGQETLTETSSDGFATVFSKVKNQDYFLDGQHFTQQSAPYAPGDDIAYTTTSYDVLGRPLQVTAPGSPGAVVARYHYDGLRTSVTDANGHTTSTLKDIAGRTEIITPPDGPTITYTYDVAGQLTDVLRAGHTTHITYDKAGRKTEMDDPDMGRWYYKYDVFGNLTAQIDANGRATNLYYDMMNRLIGKTYSPGIVNGATYNRPNDDGPYPIRYRYDTSDERYATNNDYPIGRRTAVYDPTGSTAWTYDERGRVTAENKIIAGQTYTTKTVYNMADMPLKVIYPDDEVVTNIYNAQMLLEKVTSNLINPITGQAQQYIKNVDYDVAGRVTLRVLGNDNRSAYTYYAWNNQGGRLRFLKSGTDSAHSASLQNIEYAYDNVGNISSIADVVSGQTQAFTYDDLDRLISANVTGEAGGLYSGNYIYDGGGNLKKKAGVTLYYDDVNHAHAVTSTSNGGRYIYDNNGNQVRRTFNGQTYDLDYDAEGRLISVQRSGQVSPPTATPTSSPTLTPTQIVASPTRTLTPTSTSLPPSGSVTFTSIGTEDGWVLESSATSETGGSNDATTNTFNVGDDASNRQYRGILSFDTSSLPDNAVVQSATLRIKKWSHVGSDPLAASHLRVDIAPVPGRFGTGYVLQNMDFESVPGGDTIAIVPTGSSPDANGWYSTNLNATGRGLISLTNKTQLRLRFGQADNGDGVADYVKLISGDSGGGNPELLITYSLSTTTATPGPTRTVTATASPTVTATHTPRPPAEMTTQTASFLYDGDGKMVKSVIDGVVTIFVSPVYQVKNPGGQPVTTKYYPGGAMRVSQVALGTSTLYYSLSDHLGSTNITTDANGAKIAEMRYKAWGEVRFDSGNTPTDRTYTGQRTYTSDFGLMFYNARWYDPNIGRFAQADTIVPDGVQGLDRYAYVGNNPINFADPSGHKRVCIPIYQGGMELQDCTGYDDPVELTYKGDLIPDSGGKTVRYGGAAIQAKYFEYKYTCGWWNNNCKSEFGLKEFVGMWALFESNSTLRFADVIATVIAQNLYAGGNNPPACASEQCYNGVFNFMAAYSSGTGGLFQGPKANKNYISDRQGERGRLRDVTDPHRLISELGGKALSTDTIVGDRWNGPTDWGNIKGAKDLTLDPYNVRVDTVNGTAQDTIYYLFPSFVVYSYTQRKYFEALGVDFSFDE